MTAWQASCLPYGCSSPKERGIGPTPICPSSTKSVLKPFAQLFSRSYRTLRTLPQTLGFRAATASSSGTILFLFALSFFGAALNTIAGGLYVMSGVLLVTLLVGAILPVRALRALQVSRRPIQPVTVGDELWLELRINNPTAQPRSLLQIREDLPSGLTPSTSFWHSVAAIAPHETYRCTVFCRATQRGVYHWRGVILRTAVPFGLFWAYRTRSVPGRAVVYPQVLPLRHCSLIDTFTQEQTIQVQRDRQYQNATEGITKTLRPYRTGDPTRLIHWRTSAKFDQLQVRELEVLTSGREVTIALDNATAWPDAETFEQAVTAAASLYFYASRCQLGVQLWTADRGLVKGNQVVLETLAAVQALAKTNVAFPVETPSLCLTAQASRLEQLPPHSRYLLFRSGVSGSVTVTVSDLQGLTIEAERPLSPQLAQVIRSR